MAPAAKKKKITKKKSSPSPKKIKRLLIANRGEIAVRIIRTCREMGVETVAVFSDADRSSLHVQLADYAYEIGKGPSSESYLRMEKILEVARQSKADAVHPGYGLLSENVAFAKACEDAGIIFVGPPSSAITAMGNKTAARTAALSAKVPVVPGSPKSYEDVAEALAQAKKMKFPVLIKAVSGGGGRGMRVVQQEKEFQDAFESAAREAKSAFGDGRLYLERYLKDPRHVEIQIFADRKGNCVYLGERECSIQRRHQKIFEETPSPVLTPAMRKAMGEAAVRAAKKVGYVNAGTVEFLVAKEGKQHKFFFIEMNTRLQVEHPVTEMATGLDLVELQLRIAQGESLPFTQNRVRPQGCALEARICAEDPEQNYRPSPGVVTKVQWPLGPYVRIDSHVYDGYEIPMFYDPMIAKIITWGSDRATVIRRMIRALREIQIHGIKTNISQLLAVLNDADFCQGNMHINFLRDKEMFGEPVDQTQLDWVSALAAILDIEENGTNVAQSNAIKKKNIDISPWKRMIGMWREP